MEPAIGILIALAVSALCAAIGGGISSLKHRPPLRGCVLGALLGPIGVVLVLRMPFAHRPMVDQGAWRSFRSVVEHQSNREILQLTAMQGRMLPSPAEVARSRNRSA